MSKFAKIGTIVGSRSSSSAAWQREQGRRVLQQPRFQHQNSCGHQNPSCTRPLKQMANSLGRRITRRVIGPIRDKFLVNPTSIAIRPHGRKSGTVVPGNDDKVRVLRLEGAPLEFDYPPMAASLIMEHPNHVIVHCSTLRTRRGKLRKDGSNVTIVSGIQELQVGHKYYLLPIPASIRKGESAFKVGQAPKSTMCPKAGLNRVPREAAPSVLQVGRGRRRKIMLSAIAQGEVDTILESAAGGKSSETPLINSYSKSSSWTPALGSIPESPMAKARGLCPSSAAKADPALDLISYIRASIGSEFELK